MNYTDVNQRHHHFPIRTDKRNDAIKCKFEITVLAKAASSSKALRIGTRKTSLYQSLLYILKEIKK